MNNNFLPSSNNNSKRDGNNQGSPAPAGPQFRSMAMLTHQPAIAEGAQAWKQDAGGVIDMAMYRPEPRPEPKPAPKPPIAVVRWKPKDPLRPVPAFYPLEKSSRIVEYDTASEIAFRISHCLKNLSVQAKYDNESATAALYTAENVEMHLSLWQAPGQQYSQSVVVELQRRKGDSIAYHRYSRSILDAAVGDVGSTKMSSDPSDELVHSKRVQRLLDMELKNPQNKEHENAITAIAIAHGLLMKDRMDARQLGLESLCLLTDPRKTGYIAAILTSHVVLLGTMQGVHIPGVTDQQQSQVLVDEAPLQEVRSKILSLVQLSRIGEDLADDDMDMSDNDIIMLHHNLALAVLANALDVIENTESFNERFDADPEDTKPRGRLRTASSTDVANEFMQKTGEESNTEILKTLISELGKAHDKPHNATLSAKCIGSLCRASEEARRRAKEMKAKEIVMTALDVGQRTHLKLETECKKVVEVLAQPMEE